MSMFTKFLKLPGGLVLLTIVLVFLANINPFQLHEGPYYEIFAVFGAMVWMLMVSLIVIWFVFKEKIEDYGWILPKNKSKAVLLTFLSIAILTPIMVFFGTQDSFREFYTLQSVSIGNFLLTSVVLSFVYYIAEEFLFRGFLFWGLFHKVGYHSFWITSSVFALFHITKPLLEIPFAFFASLLFCYLSFKTKSFVPAFVVHFTIALILNTLIFI